MSERFLYLTTVGRKSGKPRQIEIWFVVCQGRYYLVSERRERAQWVQNLQVNPAVQFSIGHSRDDQESVHPVTAATGRIVRPVAESELAARVKALMDAKYAWSDGLIVELTPSA